ncbi:Vegetative incompatibility protein HET-E-1 [Rhizoctonia solani]|uniref:Vegetative incompatibility protein HET-E-1 n=1 Tax=Rhizoctonia solani TaxID=456999 RepID=A0A8H8T2Q2_9AGAM|nr:Vegetative incompatibility protein HET-E-1 [Rhizoctonia solani]QRW25828.1 Vegetative incompatibility protein HET-E-1 [Rhizoctonia solani]
MPLPGSIKRFTDRIERRLRRTLGQSDGARVQSSASLPLIQVPPQGGHGASARWTFLEDLRGVLSPVSDAFGPLKVILNELVDCVYIYEASASNRQEYEALRSNLTTTLEGLKSHFTGSDAPKMSNAITSLCESIQKELETIQALQAEGTMRQYIRSNSGSDRVYECYTRINGYLSQISLDMSRSVHRTVEQHSKDLKEQESKAKDHMKKITEQSRKTEELAKQIKSGHARSYLDRLSPSFSAKYCSAQATELKRGECTPGTRHSHVFGEALIKALERDPDIQKQLPSMQFASLISEPLTQIRASLPGIFVVVIDALDECESQESTRVVLNTILKAGDKLKLPIRFFVSSRPEPEIRQEMERRMATTGYSQLVLHQLDTTRFKPTLRTKLVADAGVLFIYASTAVRYISDSGFSRNPYDRLRSVLEASGSGAARRDKAMNELYAIVLKSAFEDDEIDEPEREDILQVLHTVIAAQEPLAVASIAALLQIGSEDRVRAAIRPLWSVLHITGSNELVATLHASFPDYMLSKERSGDYCCDRKLYDSVMARLCLECIAATRPRFNICGLDSSAVLDKDVPNLHQKIQNAVPAHLLYACRYFAAHLQAATEPHELSTLVQEFMLTQLLPWLEIMNLTGNIQTAEKAMRRVDSWAMAHTDTPELQELAHDAWCFTTSFGSNVAYKGLYRGLPEVGGTAMDMRQFAVLATWSFSRQSVRCCRVTGVGRLGIGVGGDSVTSVDFSPDGTRIVSGSDDGSIRVWDVETGQLYSPDETCIASCSYDRTIRIYDATTGETRLVIEPPEEHRSPIYSIRYSPDGAHIVAGLHDGQLYVWQASTGALVLGPLQAHTHAGLSVDYSPDGTHIISGSDDKTIRIWNAVNGHAVPGPLMEQNTAIRSVRYSPDGRHIVSGSDEGTICVWDPQTGTVVLGPLKAHNSSITSICYSPDGTRILSCAYESTVYSWDTRRRQKALSVAEGCGSMLSGLRTRPIAHASYLLPAIISTCGMHAQAVSSAGQLKSIPARCCRWITRLQVTSLPLARGQDHMHVGCSDWTHAARPTHRSHRLDQHNTGMEHSNWRADAGATRTPHILCYDGHTDIVRSIDFSPDGTRIVSCSRDRTIRMWDIQTGRTVLGPLEDRCGEYAQVRYSPRGDYICSTEDNVIWVLNANTGDILSGPHMGHTDHVSSIAISRDGARIVSGSRDRAIRVWDVDAKPSSSSNSTTSGRGAWKLNNDGWAVDVSDSSRLLVWVPHDLRAALMFPQTPFLISEKGYLTLDFGKACIGESWTECCMSKL